MKNKKKEIIIRGGQMVRQLPVKEMSASSNLAPGAKYKVRCQSKGEKKKELENRGKELGEKLTKAIIKATTTTALLAVAKVVDEYLRKIQGENKKA